ncbi:MAG TPA: hypothetical protein VIZ61_12830 [Solirubrobacterales bacterium]
MLSRKHCLLALGIALLAGCGSRESAGQEAGISTGEGVTRQISGRWTGELRQQGLKPFEVGVDIGADSTAKVAYTGIECGGDWTLDRAEASTPPRYLFTEKIDEGAGKTCKGKGTVALVPIQRHAPNGPAYIQMNYSFTGGGVTSLGLLHRTDASHLAPVFKEAGLTQP